MKTYTASDQHNQERYPFPYLGNDRIELTGVKFPIAARNGATEWVVFVSWSKDSRQIADRTVVFASPWRFSAEESGNHRLESVSKHLHETHNHHQSVLISAHTSDPLQYVINGEAHACSLSRVGRKC